MSMPRICIECYQLREVRFELWRDKAAKPFVLLYSVDDGDFCTERYSSAASARRAMYKLAWDFSPKREVLPRAVL